MNRLSKSTSPYLLQHAENPVDWYPWSQEALANSKARNKPILLSIGYAACHWCHVMAHESFEDPEIAAIMNEHFINIKVDREERPDLDGIYMQAVTTLTGSGGWPMTVFLTPELKPFYAGTYFPPLPRHGLPSLKEVLEGIIHSWNNNRSELTILSEEVTKRLQNANTIRTSGTILDQNTLDTAMDSILDSYDWENGGWGEAPKFPQAMTLDFLISHASTQDNDKKETYLRLIKHCLNVMSRGGLYDLVGGGFFRYSTDKSWRIPHFEKMLYDNALLARIYLHAWQVTLEPTYKRIVTETLNFVIRELKHPDGGFYSSLDADSDGEEGKFYSWRPEELQQLLEEDWPLFKTAYGISLHGNWDGKVVLQRTLDDASLSTRFKSTNTVSVNLRDGYFQQINALVKSIINCHSKLFTFRNSRIRPDTDDKILTSWNGLMLATFAEASRSIVPESGENQYYNIATRNAEFLLSSLLVDGKLHRSWREGKVLDHVFLEDYASLILGLLELYQTDFNNKWFNAAQDLAEKMINDFCDPRGGFFDTPIDGEVLVIRPKDFLDNATPSGNAMACEALLKLAALTDNNKYREIAEASLEMIGDSVEKYPNALARWLSAAEFALGKTKQIAIIRSDEDEHFSKMLKIIRFKFRPNVIVSASENPPSLDGPTLVLGRPNINGKVTAYVCEEFICKQPVTDPDRLFEQLQ